MRPGETKGEPKCGSLRNGSKQYLRTYSILTDCMASVVPAFVFKIIRAVGYAYSNGRSEIVTMQGRNTPNYARNRSTYYGGSNGLDLNVNYIRSAWPGDAQSVSTVAYHKVWSSSRRVDSRDIELLIKVPVDTINYTTGLAHWYETKTTSHGVPWSSGVVVQESLFSRGYDYCRAVLYVAGAVGETSLTINTLAVNLNSFCYCPSRAWGGRVCLVHTKFLLGLTTGYCKACRRATGFVESHGLNFQSTLKCLYRTLLKIVPLTKRGVATTMQHDDPRPSVLKEGISRKTTLELCFSERGFAPRQTLHVTIPSTGSKPSGMANDMINGLLVVLNKRRQAASRVGEAVVLLEDGFRGQVNLMERANNYFRSRTEHENEEGRVMRFNVYRFNRLQLDELILALGILATGIKREVNYMPATIPGLRRELHNHQTGFFDDSGMDEWINYCIQNLFKQELGVDALERYFDQVVAHRAE